MGTVNYRRRLLIASLLAGAAGSSRAFVGGAASAAPGTTAPEGTTPADRPGTPLAPWRPGCLDIHHIATGRGNATFILLPDGTSMLIDAGASNNATDVSVAPRPNASRRAGVWIARYAQRQLRAAGLPEALDYMLVTHIHPDHLGDPSADSPWSQHGKYRLTGVTDVAELMPVQTVIDRGFPDYSYPSVFEAPFADNYRAFIRARREKGLDVQRVAVGSAQQIASRRKTAGTPLWEIRNLAANGEVWTGSGSATRNLFPQLKDLPRADWPNENNCSIAIRIGYGRFSYFTAGDLTSYTDDGALPWRNVLGPAARVAGRTSVATADHHGMFDGLDGDVVRALQPRVWIIPAWHIVHPDMLQLERMFSERLYPGPRDVFATTVMKENLLANDRLTKRMRSNDGHIVVRVTPGGEQFYVAVTENHDESDMVKLLTGTCAA
jgi:beta-lactamase superfamily II metal-dependent hydrolase